MAWLFLFLAGLTEIGWAIALKYSHGFTRIIPSVITIVVMISSFFLLAQSLKTIPIGTAYAIWTGIGIVGTVILGIILFDEPISFIRLLFLSLILIGIVGLKLTQ
mgnify:FL=1